VPTYGTGIEATIYERLSGSSLPDIVGTAIYPTTPTEQSQLPFVVCTVSGTEPQVSNQGSVALSRYTVVIDVYAINLDTVLAIFLKITNALHCYRSTDTTVQGSFLTQQATQQEEYGFHGTQSFSVWATT